jgi:hypothetical protein
LACHLPRTTSQYVLSNKPLGELNSNVSRRILSVDAEQAFPDELVKLLTLFNLVENS